MVRFLYNVVQNILLSFLWPVILIFVTMKAKYRFRFWARCGVGLRSKCRDCAGGKPRIWIHALSVGELSSVVSLVKALRKAYPDAVLLLSTTSTAGSLYARQRLESTVDTIVAFPYDHFLVVKYFLSTLRPNLFVQVETDFWPNMLAEIKREAIPAFLVNGRVSKEGFARYKKYPRLFLPLFDSFSCLGMQAKIDVRRMAELGVAMDKLRTPGNLKIDAAMPAAYDESKRIKSPFPAKRLIVLGSTHPGEEELLAPRLQAIQMAHPDVRFVLAPREIDRGREIAKILATHGLTSCLRSASPAVDSGVDCLILDTMGELVHYYPLAEMAFVGGSLLAFGGHNPLEPMAFATPVLFGPYMEDFADICAEMQAEHCGLPVADADMFGRTVCALLKDEDQCKELGQAGLKYIVQRQGVTRRHLKIIDRLLQGTF